MSKGLPYFGGKGRLAISICKIVNAANRSIYIEPFIGGGQIFMSLNYRWNFKRLIISDLDKDIYDFWTVASSRITAEQLVEILLKMPISKKQFDMLKETDLSDNQIMNAAKTFYMLCNSFNALRTSYRAVKSIDAYHKRVKSILKNIYLFDNTTILNKNAFDLIRKFVVNDKVVMYLDPPYVHSTRTAGKYHCELSDNHHSELVELITSPECIAKILLSGYDNEIYKPLESKGFFKLPFEESINLASNRKNGKSRRTEYLWMNFNPLE